ncbi:uncharacterized protein FFB20_12960 [Fusarium fujikuroi]|nr:uncharacterized protein FFC1_02791 [Fusarium fujikuroi]SCN86297.1 uncharacterized protein FFE2_05921 [Fusarium fujikuroi]SCN92555.1 uncharacterized protein FFM5_05367 [Fusarium fujikuroi]SCO07992.1 uncharacterized protein FFB20_12960 [Fusarium fujikuroi]SCO31556.1 uncharacterized protein FFNC_02248 [Fusarium fujikuroi]
MNNVGQPVVCLHMHCICTKGRGNAPPSMSLPFLAY